MNDVSKQHEHVRDQLLLSPMKGAAGFTAKRSNKKVWISLCLAAGLSAALSACVVAPAQPYAHEAPAMDPREAAFHRMEQVQTRIRNMHHRIDRNVEMGYYPPPAGGDLHHRLENVAHETQSMAQHHGGGLSREDQAIANHQLDDLGLAIR